jgi:hypothetical protein
LFKRSEREREDEDKKRPSTRSPTRPLLLLAMTSTVPTTPLRRLAQHTTVTCAAQASVYGKCIVATYADVRKDSCKEEFAKFGACVREAVSTLDFFRECSS